MQTIIIDPEFKALIPPLAPDELSQLEANILRDGCRDPLVVWDGILIDGHNRHEICTRHGLPFETVEMAFDDREAAELWMIGNQMGRRNIENIDKVPLLERKREILSEQAKKRMDKGRPKAGEPPANLPEDTKETRDAVAAEIGVSGKTYDALRKVSTEGTEELKQAVRDKKVGASTAADIAQLPPETQREVVAQGEAAILREAKNIKRQRKEKRMEERREKAEKALEENHSTTDPDFRLILGDLLEAGADIADESVDVIVTDPPYPEEFLETFSKLSELAARVLKPGGHCLVMSGQSHLPEVYARLCENLKYQWTLNYYTPGQSTQVFGRKVKSNWKPVIWLIKGKNDWEHIQDTVRSDENDKRFHKWGQSVSGIAKLIELFSVQNQTVFDPFVGGGTTAIAALVTGRKFIGIDIDPLCIAMSSKRIAETRQ
jgi:site-specific DNA-methyltransferase (adenine-specific)